MLRVVAGKGYPDDDSTHDVVLVRIDGVSTPNSLESIYVESDDVDDPSFKDPGKADYVKIQANAPAGAGMDYFLRGDKGRDSLGQLNDRRPAPAIDWENLNSDNRSFINPGGSWIEFGGLSASEKDALGSSFQASQTGRPTLTKDQISTPIELNCDKQYPSPDNAGAMVAVKGVSCSRVEVDKIQVGENGAFQVWLLFKTSLQPGDNFRLMAICKSNGLVALQATIPLQSDPQNIGRLRVKKRDKKPKDNGYVPLPDPATGRTLRGVLRDEDIIHDDPKDDFPALVISDMLTVWRRLHLEADWMAGTPPGAPLNKDNLAVDFLKPDITLYKGLFKPAYV